MAAYSSRRYTIIGFDEPLRVDGAAVSPGLFSLMRARPSAGRFFRSDEEAEGANQVVVLHHGFWRQQVWRRSRGRRAKHHGRRSAAHDCRCGGARVLLPRSERAPLDTLRRTASFRPNRRCDLDRVLDRPPRPEATAAQAEAEGTAAARSVGPRPVAADLWFGKGGPVTVRVRSLIAETTSRVGPALQVMAVGVGLVLLIACANVANLFLSRGVGRSRELAVRAALGASRGRLARQLLVESLALSLTGGLVGLALAWGLTGALPAFAPADFPRLDDVRVDGRVLAFAVLASIVAGLLSGLATAVRDSRFDLSASLHGGVWSSAGGFRGAWASRMRGALLVAEAALAVMLLVGAGLLIRSFVRLVRRRRLDPPTYSWPTFISRAAPRTRPSGARSSPMRCSKKSAACPGVVAAGIGRHGFVRGIELPLGFPISRAGFGRANHGAGASVWCDSGLRRGAGAPAAGRAILDRAGCRSWNAGHARQPGVRAAVSPGRSGCRSPLRGIRERGEDHRHRWRSGQRPEGPAGAPRLNQKSTWFTGSARCSRASSIWPCGRRVILWLWHRLCAAS